MEIRPDPFELFATLLLARRKRLAHFVISDNRATFHSVAACVSLTTTGGRESFTSDNTFTIVDNGSPGAGLDAIDVNFAGASGVAVPGILLVDGDFIVVP